MHYKSFDEAKNKWFERAARVDRENLYVMLSQRDGCTRQDVERFGELPSGIGRTDGGAHAARGLFLFQSEIHSGGGCLRVLSDYVSKFSGRRYLDDFDYVRFLNDEMF